KAQQLEPKLYDGSVIQKTNAIVIRDSEETLMLAEESQAQTTQNVITYNAAYQADDLDSYDSDCDEINSAKVALMANYVTMVPMILL
nr:hypothetical protein [Tanacetum cinerariifolium]